jgi:hypothetical protein
LGIFGVDHQEAIGLNEYAHRSADALNGIEITGYFTGLKLRVGKIDAGLRGQWQRRERGNCQ